MKSWFLRLVSIVLLCLVWSTTVLAAAPTYISYEYSQGKFPGGTSYYLQSGISTYQQWQDNTRIRVNFTVTEKEMASLLATTRWYSFSSIRTAKEKIYERGGDQIVVSEKGKTVTKNNSGQSVISGAFSQWRYDRIIASLQAFTKKKIAASYKPYTLNITSPNSDYRVRLAVDDTEVGIVNDQSTIFLLPGQHQITVAVYDFDTNENLSSESFIVKTPDSNAATIYLWGKDISLVSVTD